MTASDENRERSRRGHADAGAAPIQPSERAQAKRFATMLHREVAEMSEKVIAAEVEWHLRCEAEGYIDPPKRLTTVRGRITEAERMLRALNARFPRI